jgi:SAM-dependent methyltransferase
VTEQAPVRDDWDQHWAAMAESASRNPAQAMRRRLVISLVKAEGAGTRILDVGCGQGDLVAELRRRYPRAELCGIDFSPIGIEVARGKVRNARFEQRDLLAPGHPQPGLAGWATHAVCSEVLEHVDDPGELLRNAKGYLAPGCRLVVTVPGGPISAFDRHIGHRRHFTGQTLARVLEGAGFEVERSTGSGFPFFNLYRGVVLLRGEQLVADAGGAGSGRPSVLARGAMAVFRSLLAIPVPRNRLGWQIVAVARVPAR